MITVIGKLADTQQYIGQPGYNVLSECFDWTPEMNREFIRRALERGDQLLFSTPRADGMYWRELAWIVACILEMS